MSNYQKDLIIKKYSPRLLLHSFKYNFLAWLGVVGNQLSLNDVAFSCVKTVKKTIGAYGLTCCDFNFANPANMTAQNIDLGAIIPANARVLEVRIVNKATFTGGVSLAVTAGNVSAGAQFLASVQAFTLNTVVGTLLALLWTVLPVNTASNVFIGATPGANWSLITDGKLEVNVTYIETIA